jgi:hypothetical protein
VHLAVRGPTAAVGEEVRNGRIWPTPSVTGIRPARKLSGDELPDTAKAGESFRYRMLTDRRRRVATDEDAEEAQGISPRALNELVRLKSAPIKCSKPHCQ